jgi:hypothetical protein
LNGTLAAEPATEPITPGIEPEPAKSEASGKPKEEAPFLELFSMREDAAASDILVLTPRLLL